MSERPTVFTCVGDESMDRQMVRAIRDGFLILAERAGGSVSLECNDAIGLVGELSLNTSTRKLSVTARRTGG